MNEEECRAVMQHMKDAGFHRFEAYDEELQCLKDYFLKESRNETIKMRRKREILNNILLSINGLKCEPGEMSDKVMRLVESWERGELPKSGQVTGDTNDPMDTIATLRAQLIAEKSRADKWYCEAKPWL